MALLDWLLPRRCLICALPGEDVCRPCLESLPRLRGTLCGRCGAPTAWPVERCRECSARRLAFACARAAVAYDAAVRAIVAAWKERALRGVASLAAELVADALPAPRAQLLTFVPPDRERARERGCHPAERLAHELGLRWQMPVEPLVGRLRGGPRQRGLRLEDRRRNVVGVFTPLGRAPPQVALVDDVYTSGATVSATASALRRGGARRVEVVTFARAIRSLDPAVAARSRPLGRDSGRWLHSGEIIRAREA